MSSVAVRLRGRRCGPVAQASAGCGAVDHAGEEGVAPCQCCCWRGAKRSSELQDRWLAVPGAGYVPSLRPRHGTSRGLSQRVRALLLDHNRVRALPPGAFVGAGALLHLDLRENGLRWVHARAFWGLGALKQLDLSANQLEALVPGTFAPLRALCVLSLAGNRLARLEPAALGTLPLLSTLSLQDNELPALAPALLAGLPALNTLRLRGNPWACGCALRPLCTWLRRHPLTAPEAETLICVSPGRLTLSPLTAFPDAAFNHCARPLAARELAVVYALGPGSFLASLAACLALGSMLTACRARRRRAAARRPPRSLPDPGAGMASPAAIEVFLTFLSASPLHTPGGGGGVEGGARRAPGAEGQCAAALGPQRGKAHAWTREGLGLYKVTHGAEDSPEPASGEAHPGLRARGGEEKAQPSRSPEKGEAVGSPSAPLGGGCQLGGQGLQSGKGRASSEDGVKRRRGVGKKG
ncbi:hypothetical protein EI555_013258, partial [Monodon monoceros]